MGLGIAWDVLWARQEGPAAVCCSACSASLPLEPGWAGAGAGGGRCVGTCTTPINTGRLPERRLGPGPGLGRGRSGGHGSGVGVGIGIGAGIGGRGLVSG